MIIHKSNLKLFFPSLWWNIKISDFKTNWFLKLEVHFLVPALLFELHTFFCIPKEILSCWRMQLNVLRCHKHWITATSNSVPWDWPKFEKSALPVYCSHLDHGHALGIHLSQENVSPWNLPSQWPSTTLLIYVLLVPSKYEANFIWFKCLDELLLTALTEFHLGMKKPQFIDVRRKQLTNTPWSHKVREMHLNFERSPVIFLQKSTEELQMDWRDSLLYDTGKKMQNLCLPRPVVSKYQLFSAFISWLKVKMGIHPFLFFSCPMCRWGTFSFTPSIPAPPRTSSRTCT